MTAAVLFDMDGVLIDSEPRHLQAFEEVFADLLQGRPHGLNLPSYVGRSDRAVWMDFIEAHRPALPLNVLTERKQNRVIEIFRREAPIFPGVPDLLESLAARYPLAVASGSVHAVIREVLALKGLSRHFRAVASVEDVGQSKPAPDVFLRAAALLGVSARDCWVVEDSLPGVQAGLAAGAQVIAITNTHSAAELHAAHHVVSSYQQIADLIL
jgi:HAD superfamily hydrolase (TIGR01509 family)